MDRAVLRDSRAVVLDNLELAEKRYLKRAACLLFSDKPERYVSGAWVKIGFFVTDDNLRYQDESRGGAEHLDAAISMVLLGEQRYGLYHEGYADIFDDMANLCERTGRLEEAEGYRRRAATCRG